MHVGTLYALADQGYWRQHIRHHGPTVAGSSTSDKNNQVLSYIRNIYLAKYFFSVRAIICVQIFFPLQYNFRSEQTPITSTRAVACSGARPSKIDRAYLPLSGARSPRTSTASIAPSLSTTSG
jgi:hypothetical protein